MRKRKTKAKDVVFSFAGDTKEEQQRTFKSYDYYDFSNEQTFKQKRFSLKELLNLLKYRVNLYFVFSYLQWETYLSEGNTNKDYW